MKEQLIDLISETTSPLFRIMSIYEADQPNRRKFHNNMTAFHIGDGYILTVAHNLKSESQLVRSIDEQDFQDSIIANCNANEEELFNNCYILDPARNKRYLNITDQNDTQPLIEALKRINYDTRWITQYERELCKPFLIIQFDNPLFYNSQELTDRFEITNKFPEPSIEAHTFIIELELRATFYSEDIAVYRMINVDQEVIDSIPSTEISFDTIATNNSLYCLQSSPSGTNLGRMINESRIEGVLDHHAIAPDRIGGNFVRKGLRYLLKGYFRFGSSGAPYFSFDQESNSFTVNAIQSEASPIQLTINGDRKGNAQYINAIATPLSIIEERLNEIINPET